MRWLFRNWQLKIAAVALATILYTGLVYSGSFTEQTMPGVPIRGNNQPNGFLLTDQLGSVSVTYRAATDITDPVTPDAFSAMADLSGYDMTHAGEPQSVAIRVSAVRDGITVLSFSPEQVSVAIDTVASREVPVTVDRGVVPDGLEIGEPTLTPQTVTARGPQSRLRRVDHAVAAVRIDPSGIDVDGAYDLTAVDALGRPVESIELTPASVSVKIDVSQVETTKTVPVRPQLGGNPAPGFAVTAVEVTPATVTLRGQPDALAGVTDLATEPLDISGATSGKTFTAGLVLPKGTRIADTPSTAKVVVRIAAATGTRTFLTGVVCSGAAAGTACLPSQDQLAVTLSGPVGQLDAVDPTAITPVLDVTGLGGGHPFGAALDLAAAGPAAGEHLARHRIGRHPSARDAAADAGAGGLNGTPVRDRWHPRRRQRRSDPDARLRPRTRGRPSADQR